MTDPQPLTPAAEAVLETGLRWQHLVESPGDWSEECSKAELDHLDAIRRYRETL